MVKMGKMFKKGRGGVGDDASVYSKAFGRKPASKSPLPTSEFVPTTLAPIPAGVAAPVALDISSAPHASSRRSGTSKKSKSPTSPSAATPSPVPSPAPDARDDSAPSPASTVPSEAVMRDSDPGGGEQPANLLNPAAASASASASYEETVRSSEEEGSALETYDEEEEEEDEETQGEEEGEEEEVSYAGTEDNTYVEEAYSGTYADDKSEKEEVTPTAAFSARSTRTSKGKDMSKKYFHKDVVLNSLEDGANSLVIRAMYFIPKPKHDSHVVVKIEASTISARDCMKCKGHGLTRHMLPFVPGFEVVGTIQTLGDKAKFDGQFREGDRVAGVSTFGGGNSRFISIPANRLTKISNNVKSTQAVCMIADYMAALKALRLAKKSGSPFTGMNVLITDGFSPIGQAVINLAGMEGANIYCCADESKHAYLASLGTKCFVKDPDTWLQSATGTFDVVIDNSCIDSYSSSWFAINQKGSLVCVAPVYNIDNDDMPNNGCGVIDVDSLNQKWAGLKAKYMMTQTSFLNTETCYDDDTDQYKQDLRYLMFLLERGDVKPKVAERVSLDDVPDAQRLMQSGRANGTVVCVPWIEG